MRAENRAHFSSSRSKRNADGYSVNRTGELRQSVQ